MRWQHHNLVKHLRFNHGTEYDEVIQVWRSKEEKKGGARVRQISLRLTVGKRFSSVGVLVCVSMYKQYRFHLTLKTTQ